METTPVHPSFKHYVYEESTKTIWFMDDKPTENPEWVYLGMSNNPIPASAATALTQKNPAIKGCRVKRRYHGQSDHNELRKT